MNPDELLLECFRHCYASVFILDRLPFHRNRTLGPEDDATSDFLDEWLACDYSALGRCHEAPEELRIVEG